MSEDEPVVNPFKLSEAKDIPVDQLNNLFNAVGWTSRTPEKWKKALDVSTYVASVWDNERLIGFGRIFEDGTMANFYDIGVLPEYQGRGVGKQIMENLIDKIKDKEYASLALWPWEANPANVPFYESLGFVKTEGMELRKYMKPEDLNPPTES